MGMKINTDVNEIIFRQAKNNLISPKQSSIPASAGNYSSSPNISGETLSSMDMERSLMEALSIAQMSQSILHKAMTVSTRLRNIVSQAFTTGKINTDELNRSISEIDN